jgi:hypothetical protein
VFTVLTPVEILGAVETTAGYMELRRHMRRIDGDASVACEAGYAATAPEIEVYITVSRGAREVRAKITMPVESEKTKHQLAADLIGLVAIAAEHLMDDVRRVG